MRIGIDKDEPFAGRGAGPGITGSPDLIDRFKDDSRARSSRQFRRSIRRVVVANHRLTFPAQGVECPARGLDTAQGRTKEFLLVIRGNNDRDLHNDKAWTIQSEKRSEPQAPTRISSTRPCLAPHQPCRRLNGKRYLPRSSSWKVIFR